MIFSNIHITGVDAATFLQGQLTADIFNLTPPPYVRQNQATDSSKNSGLAGICNNKGRLIAIFWVTHESGEIILTLPSELAERVITHLKRFVFRAKVIFTIQHAVSESLIPNSENIPWITQATQEHFVPQMVNLDCLNGINFKKGCYTGQEVIARLHYLGRNKRRMIACKLANFGDNTVTSPDQVISIGDPVFTEDNMEPIGQIVVINNKSILLSIQVIYKNSVLYCNSKLLIAEKLPYRVPELEA